MVAAVCAFFAFFHFGSILLQRRRRLAAVKARSLAPATEKDDFSAKTAPSSGGAFAAPLAFKAAVWKSMIWREFTVGMWSSSSSEMFWSVAYTVAMLVFGFVYRKFPSSFIRPHLRSRYVSSSSQLTYQKLASLPLALRFSSRSLFLPTLLLFL